MDREPPDLQFCKLSSRLFLNLKTVSNLTTPNLHGLVLAGGKSTRMGQDKSLLDFHGKPQRIYLYELLSQFCAQTFISCNARQFQDIDPRYHPIPDQFDSSTPLNGILSAFARHNDKGWLVVACDMPFVDKDILHHLVSQRDQNKLATCFYNPEIQAPEPLLTIWEAQAYPLLLKFYREKSHSPKAFLTTHAVALLELPDQKYLTNVNTLQERARIKGGQ